MIFDEWWESSPTRQLGECESERAARRLTARWAWEAGYADAREELLTQFNRAGLDIDAALHGRVNEQSPIANRLRMIAAAQPQWRPMTTYRAEPEIVALRSRARPGGRYVLGPLVKDPNGAWAIRVSEVAVVHFPSGEFIGWMPLPPAPEKTK